MKHRRIDYLLIAILTFIICLWILVTAVKAEEYTNNIEWHGGGFITANFASGAGYEPGIGVLAEGQARWKFLELKVGASAAWQKKKNASFGYTLGGVAQLRGFFYQDLYAVGSYSIAGYKSVFDNGVEWEKSGSNVGFGVGWETDYVDLNLIYYLEEKLK